MNIRHATMADVPALARIEAASYPPAEGASEASIAARVAAFPDHFWLLTDDSDTPTAFVNGLVTDERDLLDVMYDDPGMHDPCGKWQMIFSVVTDPARRHEGLASRLMEAMIADCRSRGRAGIVLTCKDALVGFYARFGFVDEGMSTSTHGDVAWHQMRLML